MAGIDPDVLDLLRCPVPECRALLEVRGERLVCRGCGRRYPMQPGWPVLIPEEAEMPDPEPPQAATNKA